MKEREAIKKLLKVCKIKTKRNNILENLGLSSDIRIGINLHFPEDELLFDIILIQVAIYKLYNLSKVYAQMNIMSLIKNPDLVTA